MLRNRCIDQFPKALGQNSSCPKNEVVTFKIFRVVNI